MANQTGESPFLFTRFVFGWLISPKPINCIAILKRASMNRLISIWTILVVSAFLLIANTPNLSNAYGCNNSTSTNHTAGINGTSGNITKSALTGSSQIFGIAVTSSGHKIGDQGPPQSVYIAFSVPRSGTITTVKPCQGGGTGGGLTGGGGGGGGSSLTAGGGGGGGSSYR